jgi:hypothetical protein
VKEQIISPAAFLGVWGIETGSHYVAQAGLELRILLPQPLKSLGLQCVLLCLASSTSSMLFFL